MLVCDRPGTLRLSVAALVGLFASTPAAFTLDPAKAITQHVHQVWRTDHGLPANTVTKIVQTPDGYLWLGTDAGVVRFDGVRFKTYDRRNTPELVNDNIQFMLVDHQGALWLGTVRGLLRMAGGVVTRYASREGFSEDRVSYLAEDGQGNLWIGTATDGLYRYRDGKFTVLKTRDGLIDDGVRALLVDRRGDLWIGTRGGLQRFKGGAFTTWTRRQGLAHDFVTVLHEDREGSLWIGTFAGLNRLRENGRLDTFTTREGLSHKLISGIVEDDQRSLWIGTYGGGLNRFAHGRVSSFTTRNGLSSDFVGALFLDREGSLWIAAGELNRLKDGPVTAYGTREGLSHEVVRAVYEDPSGTLWVGTHGGGLNRFDGERFRTFRTRDGLLSDVVFALQGDGEGGLWVGCYDGGLTHLRNGRFVAHRHPELPSPTFITAIVPDREGGLWLGTFGGGVKRLENGRLRSFTTKDGLSSDVVWALLQDRRGSLWVGTRLGLNRLKDGLWSRYTVAEGLPHDTVEVLHEDEEGSLWVGTDGGLARFRDGQFTSFTLREGLFDDRVMQILEDDGGRLWIGSTRGIFRVRKSELEEVAGGRQRTVRSVAYGVGDGMRSPECNGGLHPSAWKGGDGRLWFSTMKGVVVVDPRLVEEETSAPPVVIEEATVDGQPLGPPPVETGPGSRQFEFHYTALDLRSPERLRFRYRLEGVDPDWVEAHERRVAYYTNLPPGRHRFRVIATAGGPWSEAGASLEFRVRPRFHQTPWFYALCLLTAGGAVWAGHRYRVRRLLQVERVRMRIASDLHDEIGAGLSQIAILSEVARRKVDEAHQPLAEPLARIAGASRELVDSMSDIVWAINPGRDQLDHLAHRMRRFASDTLTASGIALRFHAPEDDRALGAEMRRQVLLIFKESVNNVARHSGATEARIELRVEAGRLSLRIADDGHGFEPAAVVDGHGLLSMGARARELGGELVVDASPGRGTTLTLTLPLGRRPRPFTSPPT